ncbi:MAG: fasciclin domain-containing protein [Erythrobacter sp.]|uniref:fasciclin domain-containing protein n=1 Tax=Erythrobacter sp. TaxID=1042 RepID=UPI0026168E7F|nr:fasciclin domain-containing protein [Erythrobacter sp.]MDJ0978898.1 fasciclin domain-containing protein [Erythrobacter sp.]
MSLALASTTVLTLAPDPALAHHKRSKAQADLVDTAAKSKVHKTLVTAVKAADLVDTLKSAGPFTVFAPTDTAFAKLPEGSLATLVKPESKATLSKILTYHVVAGRVTASDLANQIKLNGGEYRISTVAGPKLTARLSGDTIVITDAQNRTTAVTRANVSTSNGVIHFTDGVFLPG